MSEGEGRVGEGGEGFQSTTRWGSLVSEELGGEGFQSTTRGGQVSFFGVGVCLVSVCVRFVCA